MPETAVADQTEEWFPVNEQQINHNSLIRESLCLNHSGGTWEAGIGCRRRSKSRDTPPRHRSGLPSSKLAGHQWSHWACNRKRQRSVVPIHLKKISQLGWLFPMYGKIQRNAPNHQRVYGCPHHKVSTRHHLGASFIAPEPSENLSELTQSQRGSNFHHNIS